MLKRREFLKIGGFGVGSVILKPDSAFSFIKKANSADQNQVKSFDNSDLEKLEGVTPVKEFYVTTNVDTTSVNMERWNLAVGGLVKRPKVFNFEDILNLPAKSEFVTLECVGNRPGGQLMGNALWTGVPLKTLIDIVGPDDSCNDVVFFGKGDYSDSIPFKTAQKSYNLLAYKMNNANLTHKHGYPLRLVVPGIHGMKSVKWLNKIEFVKEDFKGFYQKRGWSKEAVIDVNSRIDTPFHGQPISEKTFLTRGVAFAGTSGIKKVEISGDGGESWQEANLKPPLSPYSWALWERAWEPPGEGEYDLTVRAMDKNGIPQEEKHKSAFPDGSGGLHNVNINVR